MKKRTIQLLPELKKHVTKGEPKGIHHPLVVCYYFNDEMIEHLNKRYEQAKHAVDQALKDKNYESYVFWHERPYRLKAFYNIFDEIKHDGNLYWSLLHKVFNDCNMLSDNLQAWEILFEQDIPNRANFMSVEDQAFMESLPEEIDVFRGYSGNHRRGISYTLDKGQAVWFSKRYGKEGKVLTARVKKQDVVAYTNARGEQTVIITKPVKTVEIKP